MDLRGIGCDGERWMAQAWNWLVASFNISGFQALLPSIHGNINQNVQLINATDAKVSLSIETGFHAPLGLD
jgi:hypothetical protein